MSGTSTVPSRDDVVDALRRVLESPAFARSERARAFLAHVVSETLADRSDRISERTVGRAVLGRGPSFDGAFDSSVRVTATRVRRALLGYYEEDGAEDPLRIVLPRGSYVPVFEAGHPPEGTPPAVRPGVLVIVPEHAGGHEAAMLAASTADSLVQALLGYHALTVVGPTFAAGSPSEAARRAGLSHALDGRVTLVGGEARLTARLVSSTEAGVRWSRSVGRPADEWEGLLDVDQRWAHEIAAEVGDLSGIILSDVLTRSGIDAGPLMRARLAYARYVDRATKQSTRDAITAVDTALEVGLPTAELLAMRGALENAAVLFDMSDRESGTEAAESWARKALAVDATNAHAYLVLGGCARGRRRWSQCRQYAEQAAALTPWQPANVATAGLLLAASGEWDEGTQLIRRALRLNPRFPVNVRLWLSFDHTLHGRYELALTEASTLDVDGQVFGPLYRCLALSGLGDVEAARHALKQVLAVDPTLLDTAAEQFLASFNLTEEQLALVLGLLERARPL